MDNIDKLNNPFTTISYKSELCFCGREKETEKLVSALENERNVTLISPRKMGKTGLIKHFFAVIKPQNVSCFYVDLDQTRCLADLVKVFGKIVLESSSSSKRAIKEVLSFFKSLRPSFSSDSLTGSIQCNVLVQPQAEETSLKEIFAYLEQSKRPCYVAFDEFQAIEQYPEKNTEAILRSYIQHLNNVHFVFAGSQKHIMIQMFTSAKRPFYQSTQFMQIDAIDENTYFEFSNGHFVKHKQNISKEVFHELYTCVQGHTWYVQTILNRLYQSGKKEITAELLYYIINDILLEYKEVYRTYCKLLTARQEAILSAIAGEGYVKEIGSSDFIQKYNLGATSTIHSAVPVLIDKELVTECEKGYYVSDRFFAMWLKKRF